MESTKTWLLPEPGARIDGGRYTILALLGKGGMGAVFRARQEDLSREVALKILLARGADDPGLEDRARRLCDEARAAARIGSRHVVEVIDAGVDETWGHFIVFEYLPGQTLRDVLKERGPLGWRRAFEEVGLALLEGLASLHGAKVIHRDVKPENLLRAHDGSWKLGDLGLAHFPGREARTALGTFFGTPGYLAPERMAGDAVGPGADLYAAAVTLVEVATGRLPFAGDDPVTILKEQTSRDLDESDLTKIGVPRLVAAVLIGALARDPAYRAGDARQVLAALEKATNAVGEKSGIRTLALPSQAGRGRASFLLTTGRYIKKRFAALVTSLVLLLMACVVGYFALRKPGLAPPRTHTRQALRLARDGVFAAGRVPDSQKARTIGDHVLGVGLGKKLGIRPDAPPAAVGLYYLYRAARGRRSELAWKLLEDLLVRYGFDCVHPKGDSAGSRVLLGQVVGEVADKGEWSALASLMVRVKARGASDEGRLLYDYLHGTALMNVHVQRFPVLGNATREPSPQIVEAAELVGKVFDQRPRGVDFAILAHTYCVCLYRLNTRPARGLYFDVADRLMANPNPPPWAPSFLQWAPLMLFENFRPSEDNRSFLRPTALPYAKRALALAKGPSAMGVAKIYVARCLTFERRGVEAARILKSVDRKNLDAEWRWILPYARGKLLVLRGKFARARIAFRRARALAPPLEIPGIDHQITKRRGTRKRSVLPLHDEDLLNMIEN